MGDIKAIPSVDDAKVLSGDDTSSDDWKGLAGLASVGAAVIEKGAIKLRVSTCTG